MDLQTRICTSPTFLGRFCAPYNLKITDLGNLNSNSILWFFFSIFYIYNSLKILIKIRQTLASWSKISLILFFFNGSLGFKTSSYILQGETIVSLKQRNQKMINNDLKAQPVLTLYYLYLFSCATGDWIVSHYRDSKILLFLSWNCDLI